MPQNLSRGLFVRWSMAKADSVSWLHITKGLCRRQLSSLGTKRRIPARQIVSYGWPRPNKNCAGS